MLCFLIIPILNTLLQQLSQSCCVWVYTVGQFISWAGTNSSYCDRGILFFVFVFLFFTSIVRTAWRPELQPTISFIVNLSISLPITIYFTTTINRLIS